MAADQRQMVLFQPGWQDADRVAEDKRLLVLSEVLRRDGCRLGKDRRHLVLLQILRRNGCRLAEDWKHLVLLQVLRSHGSRRVVRRLLAEFERIVDIPAERQLEEGFNRLVVWRYQRLVR